MQVLGKFSSGLKKVGLDLESLCDLPKKNEECSSFCFHFKFESLDEILGVFKILMGNTCYKDHALI